MDYQWPTQRRWLRAVMLMDLQGEIAGPDGRSGSISGPADREVFSRIRSTADAVIVGAQTLRAERYQPMIAKDAWQEPRRLAGQSPAPQLVFVSGSLNLPWDEAVFRDSYATAIVATRSGHSAELLETARTHATVIESPGDRVDPVWLVDRLESMGHRRLVCEGGRHLLDDLAAAGVVDEWDLTLGPSACGVTYSLDATDDAGGFHFLRYRREESA